MIRLHAGLAMFAMLLGTVIALQHPLWSEWLTPAFFLWALTVYLRPLVWLAVLPALLPVAGFSPWTGWIGVEEFDLLALGAVLGSQARLASGAGKAIARAALGSGGDRLATCADRCQSTASARLRRRAQIAVSLLGVSYLLSLLRALAEADGLSLGWFQGYEDPLNSLRVAKSFALILLLLPSLLSLLRSQSALAERRLAAGVATGLALVGLAVVWERAGYPGLLDFSTPYRSTALFWEMHVGGAAIDGFLVLAVPFAAYALAHARAPWQWSLAAVLALVTGYACLTTFSRAVYLGVGVGLCVLTWLRVASRGQQVCRHAAAASAAVAVAKTAPWRRRANRALAAMLVAEVLVVLALGDFMGSRLAASERDLGGRLEHWREGLGLLRTPSEWLFGRGLGRFPANYSQTAPGRAMPGRLQIVGEGEEVHLRIFKPDHGTRSRGAFDLLQRLPPLSEGTYTLAMDLRSLHLAKLRVGLCHTHLLYAAYCPQTVLRVPSGDAGWRRFSVPLAVGKGSSRVWPAHGLGFLSLRPEGPTVVLDVDNLSIVDARGQQLLHNGDFTAGMTHWFFAGYHYFVPWHIDNLFLETLIDQGAIGLLALLGVVSMAVVNLLRGRGRRQRLAPYLLAALAGALVVGLFSSLLDMPRTAFLFYLLICFALFVERPAHRQEPARPLSVAPQAP